MLRPYWELPRAVHVLCVGTFINRAGTLLLPFLTLYLTRELGFGVKFASLGMGAIGLGSIVGALVGGHLADRFGRRLVMLVSLFGSAGVLIFFGRLTSPYTIIPALILFACLADMYRPAASAMIGDLVPPEQRPYAFGLVYFAINLGFPIGTVVGGMVAEKWFQALFWADALTACIYAIIITTLISETLPSRQQQNMHANENESKRHGHLEPATNPSSDSRAAFRHILRDTPFLIFCLASLLLGVSYMQSYSTLPVYMRTEGIDIKIYGRLIAINGLMIVLLQIPLTAWMKKYNRVVFVCAAAVITGLGFGATALGSSVSFLAITIMIWTLGEIMIAPFSHAIVTDMAPVAYRGRYMGVFTMCFASANMIGAPLGGLALDAGGGSVLWGGTLVLGLVAAVLFAVIHRHIASKPDKATA